MNGEWICTSTEQYDKDFAAYYKELDSHQTPSGWKSSSNVWGEIPSQFKNIKVKDYIDKIYNNEQELLIKISENSYMVCHLCEEGFYYDKNEGRVMDVEYLASNTIDNAWCISGNIELAICTKCAAIYIFAEQTSKMSTRFEKKVSDVRITFEELKKFKTPDELARLIIAQEKISFANVKKEVNAILKPFNPFNVVPS